MQISIVIPVYNEAPSLVACLDAIAEQNTKPFEVIIVDNNSSDQSVAIASSYPFVKLLHEPKQGVMHARTLGFDAARGEIIARIDADTIIPKDWTEQIAQVFSDTEIQASSGIAQYYNLAYAGFFSSIDLFFRRRLSHQLGNKMYLWGANMAIRKSAWDRVRTNLCHGAAMHEDFDIAIHMQELGDKVTFDERLRAQVSTRRVDTNYLSFLRYAWASPQTYAMHDIAERTHMYPVVALCAIGYFPMRLLYRGYDNQSQSFSLAKLMRPTQQLQRVDPTSNIV